MIIGLRCLLFFMVAIYLLAVVDDPQQLWDRIRGVLMGAWAVVVIYHADWILN